MPSNPSVRDRTVTRILGELAAGDRDAADALLPRVYDELHDLASKFFREQPSDHTLQPTALVHEAYLRIAGRTDLRAGSRGQFFTLAATVMRHVLVDHARAQATARRGGDRDGHRVSLAGIAEDPGRSRVDLLDLEDVLERLARLNPDDAQLVVLRFHGGLTGEEAAEALGISRTEVVRRWRRLRAWLAVELGDDAFGAAHAPAPAPAPSPEPEDRP